MIWDDYMRIRAKGLEPFTPWHLHDKVKCYDFLEALNIPTSKILRRFASPPRHRLVWPPRNLCAQTYLGIITSRSHGPDQDRRRRPIHRISDE